MSETDQPKVWWAEPSSVYTKQFDIKPFFSDVDLTTDRLSDMAKMERHLCSHQAIPPRYVPDELRWYQKVISEKGRNLPDAYKGHAGTPIVSEAMYSLLSEFDLGLTTLFECPLYEILASDKLGRTVADRTKQDPRRWFLLHVAEIKSALRPEHCVDLDPGDPRRLGLYRVYGNQNPTIALDRETALKGPPIWRDPEVNAVYFFADSVKRAMAAKGLRTPAFKFKPCLLV